MKKFIALVVFLALAVIFIPWLNPAGADQSVVNVYQNNQLVKSVVFKIGVPCYVVNGQTPGVKMDVAPFIQNDRTFVPVRFLGNALGVNDSNIIWNNGTQTATLKGNATLEMTIGQAQVVSNGVAKSIDVAPMLQSDRTFLPARYVAEGLGFQVGWDEATQTVVCWPAGQTEPDVSAAINYLNGQTNTQQPVQQTDYTVVNGYNIPNTTDLKVVINETDIGVELASLVRLWKPLDKQYQDITNILLSKFGSQTVSKVVTYVQQKQTRNQGLPRKSWQVNGYTIEAVSTAGDDTIEVLVRSPK